MGSPKLMKPTPLVSSSESLRKKPFVNLLVVLSVVFHGGLLLLPMPQGWLKSEEPEQDLADEELEQSGAIALTTLPIITKPEPAVPAESEPTPTIIEPPPLTQVPDDILEDIPEELEEEPEEEPEGKNIEEGIEAVPAVPPETTDNNLNDQNNEPEAGIAVPFNDDFPHIIGAQSGCYGLDNCRFVEGQTFRDVAKEILQTLEAKGYELTAYDNDDSGEGNHRIYKMRLSSNPEGELKYLNIFGEGLTGAFYVITPKVIERGDLERFSE